MNIRKRLLSFIICGVMAFSACPLTAFADDSVYTGGLCEHHTEHNEECGYIEAVEESPCTHEHTEECYRLVTDCVHEHTEKCYLDGILPAEGEEKTADGCAHVCSEESGCVTKELDCEHEHSEECGYVPAKEGNPCGYWCEICAGETEKSDKADVTDETDEIEIDNTDKTEEPEKTDETDETEESEKSFSPMSERAIEPKEPKGEGTEKDPYEISTAGELYWFAGLVNGDESIIGDGTSQDLDAWAELTENITLNEDVLDEDGNLNEESIGNFIQWTPIGKDSASSYKGTFDGQKHTISGMYINSDASVGLFAFIGSGAAVKNVGIEDSYVSSRNAGGVCGWNNGTITNCYNTGTVSSTGAVTGTYAGGVCGISYSTVKNCYNTGAISGTSASFINYVGGVCGNNDGGTVENCYYLSGTAETGVGSDSGTDTTKALTVEQMTGSAAKDNMMGFDFDTVWRIKPGISTMAAVEVALSYYPYLQVFGPDSAPVGQTESVNIMDKDEEGYFLIYSKEDLKDFAAIVNGTLSDVEKAAYESEYGIEFDGDEKNINAKLTANIVLNKNVLNSDGNLNSGTFEQWTPIGGEDNKYTGTFDGNGHKISGLYIDSDDGYIGLFGYIGNGATVKNVGIEDSYINFSGGYVGGGVCGWNNGTITNCYNTGTVSSEYAGGVCGWNNGTITNCYNTGTVSGEYAGGVCGYNDEGEISNCYNTGTVNITDDDSRNYAGGVCGYNYKGTVTNCYNTGTVSGTGTDSVSGSDNNSYAGGVCGWNNGTIENCYNTGTVSGSSSAGGVCGRNLGGTVKNCYYLSGTAETGVGSDSGTAADIEEKSQSQFSSGEVAWLLQNGQEDQVWGQEIGKDELPRLSYNKDDKVCKVTFMNGGDEAKTVYINMGKTIEEPDIDVGKGFYVDGWYTDSDFGGDEWDFENDTIDDDITLYADVEERKSSGGSYSLSEGIDRDEPKDEPEEEPEVEPDAPGTTGFIDVSIFDWYYDGVMYATENGIMSGVGGNRFEPETELKREMLAVILWNMTDNPEPNGIAPFLDVTSDKYYAKAIAWANENGVMYGYGEEFGVGEAVTREDFAAILYRYAAFKGYDTTYGGMAIWEFIDFEQIADYAVEALGWAVNSGIISGMGDGTISPKTSTYRGQAAVMLMKFCENIMK